MITYSFKGRAMKDRKKLFFVGIKHSGKTTYARELSSLIGYEFQDSDDLIMAKLGNTTIREFYKTQGKTAFMEKEIEAVEAFLKEEKVPFILSLGGGASDNAPLMGLLDDNGYIIYLKREEKDILPIILKHGVPAFLDENDLEGSFHALFKRRDAIYSEYADLIIELGPYGDIAETRAYINRIMKENGYGI